MQLYLGTAQMFIKDATMNQIAKKLKESFFAYFGYSPSQNEYMSWQNSLRAIKDVFESCNLSCQGVLLEYILPSTSSRLDCMITGMNEKFHQSALIIELKQWQLSKESLSENEVLTIINGGLKEVLHPSVQVRDYKNYFKDFYEIFNENDFELNSCCYLHNYQFTNNDPILDDKFQEVLNDSPMFSLNDFTLLKDFVSKKVSYGEGMSIIDRINECKKRPTKKLMDSVSNAIRGIKQYILLEEQKIVYDKVFECITHGIHESKNQVLIVKGGPGTGKSVIALNLLADLNNQNYWAEYVTGSKAFTETLRKKIGLNGKNLFKYTNDYARNKDFRDVLIVDEAHRLRKDSNSIYTPSALRTNTAQVEEIISASKVIVFLIDDKQVVRPNEIGNSEYIKSIAEKMNCSIWETELEVQFRCNGSDGFVNWVNNTLGIQRNANVLWENNERFEFKIVDSPEMLELKLREKIKGGFTARIAAGFCWPWSKILKNGKLVNDIVIGDYRRPWNARETTIGLSRNIPKQSFWAEFEGGFDQIGCIYTAQGFEFDYIGVIIGKDIAYDFDKQEWIGFPENCFDSVTKKSKDRYIELIKNSYRVLLSRGIKGCYVYFCDKNTERYFKSRVLKDSEIYE